MEAESQEPTSPSYPVPQVEINSARVIDLPIEPLSFSPPSSPAIEAEFIEMGGAVETMKDYLAAAWNNVIEPLWDQAIEPALEKLIPQGASEIAQTLFLGHGFTPYGPTAEAVPMGEGGIHGAAENVAPAIEAPLIEPNGFQVSAPEPEPIGNAEFSVSFNAALFEAAQRGMAIEHSHDRGMDH